MLYPNWRLVAEIEDSVLRSCYILGIESTLELLERGEPRFFAGEPQEPFKIPLSLLLAESDDDEAVDVFTLKRHRIPYTQCWDPRAAEYDALRDVRIVHSLLSCLPVPLQIGACCTWRGNELMIVDFLTHEFLVRVVLVPAECVNADA